MKPTKVSSHDSILARASIWTIAHHDFLAGKIRSYVWSASATVLFLSVASLIPLQIALFILLISGFSIMILLWSLIVWRKSILLSIRDEKLRREAYGAMLALIHSRPNTIEKNKRWAGRRWRNNSHP